MENKIIDVIQYKSKEKKTLAFPVFNGETIDEMPKLIGTGYTPISVAQIMEQRIEACQSEDKKLAQLWGEICFASGDTIMYHPDGRIKIVNDSEILRNINQNTQLKSYEPVLEQGTFDKVKGKVFSTKNILKFANKRHLNPKEILKNPIWIALARGDKKLLKEYTNLVFSKTNKTTMEIVATDRPSFETERLFYFSGFGNESHIYGNYFGKLSSHHRLIGVSSNTESSNKISPVATKINLEALMNDINQAKKEETIPLKLDNALGQYEEFIKDINIAREEGIIPPAFEQVLKEYNI